MYWGTGLLGLALAVAPFVLGYNQNTAAMWTSLVLGVIVVVLSVIEAIDESKQTWEYWVVGGAGLLAVIAPFAFGFTAVTWALWVTIVIGFLILLISGYEVVVDQTTAH